MYELAPPAKPSDPWTKALIYMFKGKRADYGEVPDGLIIDTVGNRYGVTEYCGTGDCVLLDLKAGRGTVYKLFPSKQKGGTWKETILYSFPTAKQGYVPNGDLLLDSMGNLYGATIFDGGKGMTCDEFYGGNCGAVFELSPPTQKGGKWTRSYCTHSP